MRWTAATAVGTVAALAVVALLLPWWENADGIAWLVAVGGFGTALALRVERPALRVKRYLGVATAASVVILVLDVAASNDHPSCALTDAAAKYPQCQTFDVFGVLFLESCALFVWIVAFAIVGITAAASQEAWRDRREYRRRFRKR